MWCFSSRAQAGGPLAALADHRVGRKAHSGDGTVVHAAARIGSGGDAHLRLRRKTQRQRQPSLEGNTSLPEHQEPPNVADGEEMGGEPRCVCFGGTMTAGGEEASRRWRPTEDGSGGRAAGHPVRRTAGRSRDPPRIRGTNGRRASEELLHTRPISFGDSRARPISSRSESLRPAF